MEKPQSKSTLKFMKSTTTSPTHSAVSSWSSNSGGTHFSQIKSPTRDTKPHQDIKLHTQQRANKRAMFNYMVESKLSLLEQQRKQRESLHKMIEEEEIRLLRKEMVPRAQLMPFFDRPFIPQRSSRPLTVPREPSFNTISSSSKCYTCISAAGSSIYKFRHVTPAPHQSPIQ